MNTEPSLKEIAHWLRQKAAKYLDLAEQINGISGETKHTEASIQSLGGKARARALSAERRSEIGKKGSAARWKKPPHDGTNDRKCRACGGQPRCFTRLVDEFYVACSQCGVRTIGYHTTEADAWTLWNNLNKPPETPNYLCARCQKTVPGEPPAYHQGTWPVCPACAQELTQPT